MKTSSRVRSIALQRIQHMISQVNLRAGKVVELMKVLIAMDTDVHHEVHGFF
jgi:hypothetical protein